jgi:hypothetical protein
MKPYSLAIRLLQLLSVLLSVLLLTQILYLLFVYYQSTDTQAAGMLADLMIEDLSPYILILIFILLSTSNILIKRGLVELKRLRLPALILTAATFIPSYLLIPRMDYLRETALTDGFPVMLSPLARYFFFLSALEILLLTTQIACGLLITWRLSRLSLT